MDRKTFEQLFNDTRMSLWRYLRRVCGDRALAEDVFQEAYVRLLQRAPESFSHGDGRAYLYRLATNLLYDEFRARGRRQRWRRLWGIGEPSAEPRLPRSEIETAFERLTLRERTLLWLAHVEGHSHRQIAEIMGVREKSVRVLLARARQRLSRYVTGGDALGSLRAQTP